MADKVKKSISVNGEILTAIRSVKPNENSAVAEKFTRTFDFTGVSRNQALVLAASKLVIDEQRDYRAAKVGNRKLSKTVKVLDMINRARTKKTDKEKTETMMDSMTPEDIAAVALRYGYTKK